MASKRQPRLDLGRLLSMDSLTRYARKYRLPLSNSREDMSSQVNRHFSAQQFMLEEEEVLMNFIKALKSRPPPQRQQQALGFQSQQQRAQPMGQAPHMIRR